MILKFIQQLKHAARVSDIVLFFFTLILQCNRLPSLPTSPRIFRPCIIASAKTMRPRMRRVTFETPCAKYRGRLPFLDISSPPSRCLAREKRGCERDRRY